MTTSTIKRRQLIIEIEQRLLRVEPFSPNYFGSAPDDYEQVIAEMPEPTCDDVLSYLESDPTITIDGAIAAAYHDLLPEGYDGVAIDVRLL